MGYDYDITEEEKTWLEGVEYMRSFKLTDSEMEINKYLAEGKSVLAEGAQGTMLDIDHGTYPMVSSSSTTNRFTTVKIVWDVSDCLTVLLIGCAYLYSLEVVKHIAFHHNQLCYTVDLNSIFQTDEIHPTTAAVA